MSGTAFLACRKNSGMVIKISTLKCATLLLNNDLAISQEMTRVAEAKKHETSLAENQLTPNNLYEMSINQ